MSVHHMQANRGQKREWDLYKWKYMDGCEPLCRYWELNLCPLQEDLMLLTAELSLRTKLTLLKKPSLSVLSFIISAFIIMSKKPK